MGPRFMVSPERSACDIPGVLDILWYQLKGIFSVWFWWKTKNPHKKYLDVWEKHRFNQHQSEGSDVVTSFASLTFPTYV